MCIVTISDASWAHEKITEGDHVFSRRSQTAYITLLCNASDVFHGGLIENALCYFISWGSKTLKRVCRSTFRAETIALVRAVDEGVHVREVLNALEGNFKFIDWEDRPQKRKHLWLIDCKSLESKLNNAKITVGEDKRLEIDLEGLRHYLWVLPDGTPKNDIK